MSWKAVLAVAWLLAPTLSFAVTGPAVDVTSGGPAPLALNETTVDVGQVPTASIAGLNMTVTWNVSLAANESAGNISESAVYFDTASHGPGPFDRAQYAFVANGTVSSGTQYTATLGSAAPAGTLYLVIFANVSGADYYNETEWTVEVRAAPDLTVNTDASDSAVLHGSSANLTVSVAWPYADTLSSIRLLWDTAAHGTNGTNASDYANAEPGQDGPEGNYTFMITPTNAGNIFYTFAAEAMGQTFLGSGEWVLRVAGEPLVSRDSSPPWVLEGSSAVVHWSVVVDGFVNYTTELRYDSVPHASPRLPTDYPSVAGSFGATGTASFQANVSAPAGPAVYFYLVAYADGRTFPVVDLSGADQEFTVQVRPLPILTLSSAPDHGFVGRNLTVEARVAWGYTDLLQEVAVHYGPSSQGATPSLPLAYPSSVSVTAVESGWFNFTLEAPSAAGDLYFAVYARVAGVEVVSATEFAVPIYDPPTVAVGGPAWSLPSALFVANVTVAWGESVTLDAVRVYYDTVSGAPNPDPAHYGGSDSMLFQAAGTVPFQLQAPATPGPLYLFATVESAGEVFTATAEAVVTVPGAPVIDRPVITPATGYALYGQNLSVTWRVNFTENATVSADFRWDTQSHVSGGGFNFNDYPQATALLTGDTGAPFTAFFNAPNETSVIYGVVRAVLQGRNYYTAQEVVIQVIAPHTLEAISFPSTVEVGQPIKIVWRVTFQGDPALIPHTAIHWGLTSHADLPPSFTAYPGVGGPFRGNATNLFNASIPALDTPGHVYFIVHASVNGVNFYVEEASVEVKVPDNAGGGGFLPGPDAVLALAAVTVAVAAMSERRRRS